MTALGIEVFRIVTRARAADAFTGEGARLYGGRWNPKGLRVVYTKDSPSEFLLDLTLVGFEDVSRLASATQWRVPVDSPAEVLKATASWTTSRTIPAK